MPHQNLIHLAFQDVRDPEFNQDESYAPIITTIHFSRDLLALIYGEINGRPVAYGIGVTCELTTQEARQLHDLLHTILENQNEFSGHETVRFGLDIVDYGYGE